MAGRGRAHRKRQSRVGAFLFGLGCLAVLGGTFSLGVVAGRHWPLVAWPAGASAATRSEAARRGARPVEKAVRPPEPAPVLTFYRELTAPLTTPAPASAKPSRAEPSPGSRFTVQVGAFRARAEAEALRERLAGWDAYIVETAAEGPRYRVRVGSFTTRAAAREVAARLGSDRRLATYVTTR